MRDLPLMWPVFHSIAAFLSVLYSTYEKEHVLHFKNQTFTKHKIKGKRLQWQCYSFKSSMKPFWRLGVWLYRSQNNETNLLFHLCWTIWGWTPKLYILRDLVCCVWFPYVCIGNSHSPWKSFKALILSWVWKYITILFAQSVKVYLHYSLPGYSPHSPLLGLILFLTSKHCHTPVTTFSSLAHHTP
jgi:hypothetical protein